MLELTRSSLVGDRAGEAATKHSSLTGHGTIQCQSQWTEVSNRGIAGRTAWTGTWFQTTNAYQPGVRPRPDVGALEHVVYRAEDLFLSRQTILERQNTGQKENQKAAKRDSTEVAVCQTGAWTAEEA